MVGMLPTQLGNKLMIMICGDWLREYGFQFNQRLRVSSSLGKIIIESLSHEREPGIHAEDDGPSALENEFKNIGLAAVECRSGVHSSRQLRKKIGAQER